MPVQTAKSPRKTQIGEVVIMQQYFVQQWGAWLYACVCFFAHFSPPPRAAEIERVEREFEDATRSRHLKLDERVAEKLQQQFQHIASRGDGDRQKCTPTKKDAKTFRVLDRLISRIHRGTRK